MKKIILICFVGLIWQSCDKNTTQPTEKDPGIIELKAGSEDLIRRSNDFGVTLFSDIAPHVQGENMMISPLSANIALTMLLNGCGGDTYTQIHDMLGYDADMSLAEVNEAYESLVRQLTSVDNKVDLKISNAVFHRNEFEAKQTFLQNLRNSFDAEVKGLDFSSPQAVDAINNWAKEATNGLIPKVLDSINPMSVMFLMNALYFKGIWTNQFDPNTTANQDFFLEDGSVIQAPTMYAPVNVRRHFGEDYQSIELPYGRRNFSMVIIVPQGNLSSFYNRFTADEWSIITEGLDAQTEWSETEVFLPKFKFDYEKILNEELQAQGMIDAFDPLKADLSGIADQNLVVSNVKQNAFIEVNEEGTEAAAVTVVDIELTSANFFSANKPFIFAIRERTTNTLLFVGAVNNPTLN